MIGTPLISPRFIKAKNEKELEMKLLRLQLSVGTQYKFLTIYPTKDGVIAWYFKNNEHFLNQPLLDKDNG